MRTLILLILLLPLVGLAGPQVLLVKKGGFPVYEEIAAIVSEKLSTGCANSGDACSSLNVEHATLLDESGVADLFASPDLRLIVAIGLEPSQLLRDRTLNIPILFTLIPRAAFVEHGLDKVGSMHSALFLNQPIDRQFHLIQLIRPAGRNVGVLLGPKTSALTQSLASASTSTGIPIKIRHIDKDQEIGPALREILDDRQFLLALPDPLIYNRRHIHDILLFSYYNQIPVIGFSAAYVSAGALIAVYSNSVDIGQQIAEMIEEFVHVGQWSRLPMPAFPKYFRVAVNKEVSRALGFPLAGAEEIAQQLRKMESQ
ncbi:MAG: hypothetical protein KDI63_15860 [Gammaproteobacteria bacterium]|nr:hypothetical protein [Gammaproteobacteria bacterium]